MEPGFSYGPVTTSRTTLVMMIVVASLLASLVAISGWQLGTDRVGGLIPGAGDDVLAASATSIPASEIYRHAVDGVVKIVAFDARDGGYAESAWRRRERLRGRRRRADRDVRPRRVPVRRAGLPCAGGVPERGGR